MLPAGQGRGVRVHMPANARVTVRRAGGLGDGAEHTLPRLHRHLGPVSAHALPHSFTPVAESSADVPKLVSCRGVANTCAVCFSAIGSDVCCRECGSIQSFVRKQQRRTVMEGYSVHAVIQPVRSRAHWCCC